MTIPNDSGFADGETATDRLRRTTSAQVASVDLVSALAGDRVMTAADHEIVRLQKSTRSRLFYSDLLYAVSHHYFAPEVAETLWHEVLAHKHSMSTRLGRNVRVVVATLDYLSNITNDLKAPTLIAEAYVAQIANLAMRDGMTGLYNHTTCHELLRLEMRKHKRYGVGFSVALLDIDDFKSINDQHGHQRGDHVLVAVADALTGQARESDSCCRLGGDEFLVILRRTAHASEAYALAERIRTQAQRLDIGQVRTTVSVGVAVCDSRTLSAGALIERADGALRRAKLDGKNRVVVDSGAEPRPARRSQSVQDAKDLKTRPAESSATRNGPPPKESCVSCPGGAGHVVFGEDPDGFALCRECRAPLFYCDLGGQG